MRWTVLFIRFIFNDFTWWRLTFPSNELNWTSILFHIGLLGEKNFQIFFPPVLLWWHLLISGSSDSDCHLQKKSININHILNRFYHPWNFSEYMRTFDCQLVYKSCHYGITLLALDYHFYYLGCDEKLVNCAWYCGENDSKSYVQNPVLKFADVYDGRIS